VATASGGTTRVVPMSASASRAAARAGVGALARATFEACFGDETGGQLGAIAAGAFMADSLDLPPGLAGAAAELGFPLGSTLPPPSSPKSQMQAHLLQLQSLPSLDLAGGIEATHAAITTAHIKVRCCSGREWQGKGRGLLRALFSHDAIFHI
jgi:hypothetical protein